MQSLAYLQEQAEARGIDVRDKTRDDLLKELVDLDYAAEYAAVAGAIPSPEELSLILATPLGSARGRRYYRPK